MTAKGSMKIFLKEIMLELILKKILSLKSQDEYINDVIKMQSLQARYALRELRQKDTS